MTMIRPHTEYCSYIWNPHSKKDILLLESVQKFAAKVCLKQWNTPYAEMLRALDIPSLEGRRKSIQLVELYKIINGYYDLPWSPYERAPDTGYSLRFRHYNSLLIPSARTTASQTSCVLASSILWNNLPEEARQIGSISAFKVAIKSCI